MGALDRRIFTAINHWPESLSPWMRFLSEGLNAGWVKGLLVLIVIALLAAGKETRRTGILVLIAWPIANGITDLFKHGLPMVRPCNDPTLPDCILRIGSSMSAGTASAHSANMMCIATVFLLTQRWFGLPWLALALLVGISRIYNGVHYPYQVLLGWTVGAVVGGTVYALGRLTERKFAARKEAKIAEGIERRKAALVAKPHPSAAESVIDEQGETRSDIDQPRTIG